jgi:hypothetical protein
MYAEADESVVEVVFVKVIMNSRTEMDCIDGAYTVTTECFTAAPVTASMNLRFTVDGGQGNNRNMRRIVPDTLGKRSACSFENTMVLYLWAQSHVNCGNHWHTTRAAYMLQCALLLVHARQTCSGSRDVPHTCTPYSWAHTSNAPNRPINFFPFTLAEI